MTIDNLLEDVLLEIFDAYRHDMELLPRYENAWNSRDGWFKLSHVCPRWRRLVHLSPTRLHVHLLFTRCRSSRATVLKRLPPFPILVDYRITSWRKREENLALATLMHCTSRVRGITLRGSFMNMVKLLAALDHPFPELESLEILGGGLLTLPAAFLSGSAPCLRRLTLQNVAPRCISPLLSFATGLIELSLTLHTEGVLPPEPSLLPNLQRMSRLRRLELILAYYGITQSDPPLPSCAGNVVPLSMLTHLIFRGHRLFLQALIVGLVAPSLQHLDAELSGRPHGGFPIPHLCKFICDPLANCQFTAIRFVFSNLHLKFFAKTGPQSVGDPPFRIISRRPVLLEQMGQELSGPFSTVEELIITLDEPCYIPSLTDQWHGLFYHVPQVKMVQLHAKVALSAACSFQQGGQESAIDLLPALEQVKVLLAGGCDDLNVSIYDAFEPLIAARQRAGRPIRLW